jgi:hypothetical protein
MVLAWKEFKIILGMYERFIPISISNMYLLNNNQKLSLDQYQDHVGMKVLKSIQYQDQVGINFFLNYLIWGRGLYVQKAIANQHWSILVLASFRLVLNLVPDTWFGKKNLLLESNHAIRLYSQ